MAKELKTYELTISEEIDSIVFAMALVDKPATKSNFFAFKEAPTVKRLAFSDDERRELIGAAMVPDTKILRRENGKEFYVTFSAETIRRASKAFFRNKLQNAINLSHVENAKVNASIYQSFIVDKSVGVSAPSTLGDLPDGTWVIGMSIEDEKVWNAVKSGEFRGFSAEGFFIFENPDDSADFDDAELATEEDVINAFKNVFSEFKL